MRKFLSLLALMLLPCISAKADYEVNSGVDVAHTNSGKTVSAITITQSGKSAQSVTNLNTSKTFMDLTAQEFTVEVGSQVSVDFTYSNGWMHGYVYVDENNNGQFDYTANNSAHTVSGELKAYSFYSFGGSEQTGYNSSAPNTAITGDNRAVIDPPAFTAPTTVGKYRMRLKIDWNSIDPKGALSPNDNTATGSNGIVANGGYIIDVTLNVVPGPFPAAGTHYVTFKGTTTDRKNWLYNDLTQSDGYTIQAQNKGEGNEFIWKVVTNGSRMTSLVNGQGQNGIRGRHSDNSWYYTEQLDYETHGVGYYLKPYNATNMNTTNSHNCLNVAQNGNYQNAAGQECVTSWSTTAGPNAADNIWLVTEVTDKDFYEVVITDGVSKSTYDYSVASYVTYNSQKATNGGFFAVAKGATITEGDLTAENTPAGKVAVISVDGTTIRVHYVDAAPINVTYTFNLNGMKIGEKVVTEYEGMAPTVASTLPSYSTIVSGLPPTVTETEYTLETAHQNLPFTVGEDNHYYMHEWGVSQRHYLLYANENDTAIKETKQDQADVDVAAIDDEVKLEHIWVVGGDWFNGFTFKNAKGYYISAPSATPDNGADAVATKDETALCHFDPFVQAASGKYSFRPHGGSNCLAHNSDGHKKLGFYGSYSDSNLEATTFAFIDANDDCNRIVGTLQDEIDGLVANRQVGTVGYPSWHCDEVVWLFGKYGTGFSYEDVPGSVTFFNYYDALDCLNNYYSITDVVMPDDGKAYTISNVTPNGSKRMLYYRNDGNTFNNYLRASDNNTNPGYEHTFYCRKVGENKFVFVNEMGIYVEFQRALEHAAGETYRSNYNDFTFAKMVNDENPRAAFGAFSIYGTLENIGEGYLTARSGSFNAPSATLLFNDDDAGSTAFVLTEVENPNKVKVSCPNPEGESLLDGKYVGTFSANYNVELRNGLKAYTATLSEDKQTVVFTLLGEDGTIVPKHTGVLVYSENAEASITKDAIPAIATVEVNDNIFLATNGGSVTINEGDLVLGNGNKGVGFYLINPTKRTVGRNKAYIPGSEAASVARYMFDFENDGTLTEIEAIEAAPAAGNIFDLQGRRVQNAQKGLYIVNGKKVVR